MKRWIHVYSGALGLSLVLGAQAQVLTVEVGSPGTGPEPLVNHGDSWHFRKGTNEPQADWKTAAEAALDDTWQTGPGGFGYGDGDDATELSDMFNGYTTVYIRRSFTIVSAPEPGRRLALIMDWDDGFVAYIDGVEVARSSNVDVPDPVFDSTTVPGQNHEASAGAGGNPPSTFDLGLADELLGQGDHVLAIHGLNAGPTSSDLSLIADLQLGAETQTTGGGSLFAIVKAAQIPLTGTNTIAGATRVLVNGEEALWNEQTGEWSRTHSVTPGLNHLFVAAVDQAGKLLASVERDVIYETNTSDAGGLLSVNTTWDGGAIHVASTVTVPDGVTLTITGGASVLLAAGASIRVGANGVLQAIGTEAAPIFLGPLDGNTTWGDLTADGAGASVTLRHVELVAGQVRALTNGTVLVEDSLLRDMHVRQISEANHGAQVTFRRCHLNRYAQMHFDFTPVLIEDCLLENVTSDATDFEGAPAGILIRRNTYRFGIGANTDAVDTGHNVGLTVEQCLIRDFPDKAVSIADRSDGTVVRHSLILGCGDGISAYASSNCLAYGNTISGCRTGIFLRANAGIPAEVFATNNIVWGNSNQISVVNGAFLELTFSDVSGGFPGPGNLDVDPLFVAPLAGDYYLSAGSPVVNAALGGGAMGITLPVGGLPADPRALAVEVTGPNELTLRWIEDADNETGFEIQRSPDGATWEPLATTAAGTTSHVDASAALATRYFYRVRAVNDSGHSAYSNLSSGARQDAITYVREGTLNQDTTWSPAMGTILVLGSVIVPTNVTLTLAAGTRVMVTNSASLRAIAGGTIRAEGTPEKKVQLLPAQPGQLWGDLSARFAGASLLLRHAEVVGSQTTVYSNAVGMLEDCYFHDYVRAGSSILVAPIIMTHFAAPSVVRRCHVRNYYETLFRNGTLTIEDCLFENARGDGVDFDSALPGTVLRRCTFRHGDLGNVDAVDVGPGDIPGSTGVQIENCMMYDFPFDKGVSVGDEGSSHGTVVSNCFIFKCLSGVMAKDLCDVSVRHCTIVNNGWGFTNYNKINPTAADGGGILTNTYNNILWDNNITLSMWNNGRLYCDHNDLGNTNWTTDGSFANLDVNPLFENPVPSDPRLGDYRLQAGSPVRGAGRGGEDLGAHFPVGCPMAPSHPGISGLFMSGGQVVLQFWADNERTYSVSASEAITGAPWVKFANVGTNLVPRFLSFTNDIAPGTRFYRLASPALP
ncbi:MAG TPA: right-handed parallel beta-helix repeat-containing protein [Verrucomicrobiae bacterium]|nr:right-handed parallel beta-helix repeat-containing protein [Verrucomicrobiae bacterium]